MLRKARISTQFVFFLTFLWLFLETKSRGADELGYPVKIFLDADPLIFLLTSLASRSVYVFPYLALAVALLTVFFGRIFCGWICPLGTLNNMVGAFRKRSTKSPRYNLFWLKYGLLIFLLIASVFSLNLSGIFDPLSLMIRSFSVALYPAVVSTLRDLADFGEFVIPAQKAFFRQGLFIGFLFFFVLFLNLVERRFWCRYLCPLGALLGLLSRYSFLSRQISEGCNACGRCEENCQGGDGKAECLLCGDCDDVCSRGKVFFSLGWAKGNFKLDLSRRRLVGAVASGIVLPPLFKVSPAGKPSAVEERLIRPPGALREEDFLRKCVKCGECMKVCITNGLQPAMLEAGWAGIWTPVLVPRIGYCEYRCTLCGQVCPTGAIKRLTREEKEKVKIGLAVIDRGKCLPYAYGIPCIVCEEVCPTPKKAIWLEEVPLILRDGQQEILKRPQVDPHLCVGCGICEAKCPVLGSPAIYVISTGESRSKERQFLLEG